MIEMNLFTKQKQTHRYRRLTCGYQRGRDFPGGSDGKASAYSAGAGFDPWVGKIPWRRKWQPTPALLPGESRGWRSLVGYSPWGCKESDTTERPHFHFHQRGKVGEGIN